MAFGVGHVRYEVLGGGDGEKLVMGGTVVYRVVLVTVAVLKKVVCSENFVLALVAAPVKGLYLGAVYT